MFGQVEALDQVGAMDRVVVRLLEVRVVLA